MCVCMCVCKCISGSYSCHQINNSRVSEVDDKRYRNEAVVVSSFQAKVCESKQSDDRERFILLYPPYGLYDFLVQIWKYSNVTFMSKGKFSYNSRQIISLKTWMWMRKLKASRDNCEAGIQLQGTTHQPWGNRYFMYSVMTASIPIIIKYPCESSDTSPSHLLHPSHRLLYQ